MAANSSLRTVVIYKGRLDLCSRRHAWTVNKEQGWRRVSQAGEDMSKADTYLGILEAILVVGGTYDAPAHDITFQGLSFVCALY